MRSDILLKRKLFIKQVFFVVLFWGWSRCFLRYDWHKGVAISMKQAENDSLDSFYWEKKKLKIAAFQTTEELKHESQGICFIFSFRAANRFVDEAVLTSHMKFCPRDWICIWKIRPNNGTHQAAVTTMPGRKMLKAL